MTRIFKTYILVLAGTLPITSFAQSFSSDDGILTFNNFTDLQVKESVAADDDASPAVFSTAASTHCTIFSQFQRMYEITVKGSPGQMNVVMNLSMVSGVDNPSTIKMYIDVAKNGIQDDFPINGVVSGSTITFGLLSLINNDNVYFAERTSTYYAVGTGSFHSALWARSAGGATLSQPNFCDAVSLVIQNGYSVTLSQNGNTACNNFNIEAGGTLIFTGAGNSLLRLKGDWYSDGTLIQPAGKVEFNGNHHQSIEGGAQAFNNVTINNVTGVSIQATEVQITKELKIQTGTLTTNDALVITSNASGTAYIASLTSATANIVGDVTIQRYHNAAAAGWVMLAAPVGGLTVADWNDDLTTTGFPGSDYPLTSFNNIRYYDESIAGTFGNGYFGVSSITSPLDPMSGYYVYTFAGAHNIDVSGPIQKFNLNIPVTYTNNGILGHDGWNLVSNPYPSAINWTTGGAWTKTNIANEVYIYNAATGNYATYISGVSANGGSPIIASSQAFFVRATGASPTLAITENAKTTSVGVFKSNEEGSLAILSIGREDKNDELVLGLNVGVSGYESGIDAIKLVNPTGSVSVAAHGVANELLAIDHIGSDTKIIPLYINVPHDGKYDVTLRILNGEGSLVSANVEDLLTGEIHDISNINSRIFFEAGEYNDRYVLHLDFRTEDSSLRAVADTFTWIQGDQINLIYTGSDDFIGNVDVYNSIGQVVYSGTLNITSGSGVYLPVAKGTGNLIVHLRSSINGNSNVIKMYH